MFYYVLEMFVVVQIFYFWPRESWRPDALVHENT